MNKFPARDYLETVLRPGFEDAKRYFLDDLLEIKIAHCVTLADTGIISESDAAKLLAALGSIDKAAVRSREYDGS